MMDTLQNFKLLWHAILDLEEIPRTGASTGAHAAAADHGKSPRHTIRTPLKTYKDVVAAAIYLLEHFDAAADAAAADAERCARENKFYAYEKDRAGAAKAAAFHKLLTKHGDRMKQAMERIRNGVRSTSQTLRDLPSDPYWPSFDERQRASRKRSLAETRAQDDDGFLPTRRGSPASGRIIDF